MNPELTQYNNEPNIDELLQDPIMRILMHYDGMSVKEFVPLMQEWQDDQDVVDEAA